MTIDPMIDYSVHFVPLGNGVKEAVTENEDGSYTIFLDSRLSFEAQKEAFTHAMRHIMDDDFCKGDVQSVEERAHAV